LCKQGLKKEAAQKGVDLVLKGDAQALMKGWIHTDVPRIETSSNSAAY